MPRTQLPDAMMNDIQPPLLQVDDLRVYFRTGHGTHARVVRAVDGISFTVDQGETVGIVGESGCGKSTTLRGILNLVPVHQGRVTWQGQRIDGLGSAAMRPLRAEMQMIFQDPFASLNPRMTVGQIIAEPLHIFRRYPRRERKLHAMRLMDRVGLNPRYLNRYPHEFSGGQRQRIGIARALALNPKLILCDEPVSALDVSIQAQILNLLQDLQQELSLAYLFISHDLSVVRHLADRIAVMYLGRLVEMAPAEELYRNPQHPYTQALLSAIPVPDPPLQRRRTRIALVGELPSPDGVLPGCPFAGRCPIVEDRCRAEMPPVLGEEHLVGCWKADRSEA